jgi:hypothetical protein
MKVDELPPTISVELPDEIRETSGVAVSQRQPGVYWTHNDSDYGPYVYAVDSATGQTVATITLAGVTARDIEGMHLGPDGDLYVGDIGDNFGGAWPHVWIYRCAEPEQLADATVTPAVHTVRYADGPRDAESLMVHPGTGRLYIASKEGDGGGALYAGPKKLSTESVNTFERVAATELQVTGGAFSPDGSRLLLRGYFAADMYRWHDDGAPEEIGSVVVPLQRQGESVTFSPDGRTLMFGTEGERSTVKPVPLRGELLPDDVREADAAERGEERGQGQDQGQDSGGTEPTLGEEKDLPLLLVTFVVATFLVVALRRLFRRRDDG